LNNSVTPVLLLLASIAALFVAAVGWWMKRSPKKGSGLTPHSRSELSATTLPAITETLTRDTGSATLLPQSTLGRYQIERELGHGAMGAVYLGHDPQRNQPVALKTMALAREFQGDELAEARERFFREAEVAKRLKHPDIVTVFETGEVQGLAFIAMEYLSGNDLLRYTQPSKLLPVPVVLHTLARVAHALAYAHKQGVIHRDVKPANVMIDPSTEMVKITDFGVARIIDVCRTRTGIVLGTPSFMSPEQLAGRPLDGRSDLYAVGVMLFQLLTGELPHQSDSAAQLMAQITNTVAPDVRTLRPELPEALANIVALALEKRAELRYANGQQLADDLLAVASAMGLKPPLN
jgi:eukaryotic-like serine/threonine-protein kinase